MEEKLFAEMKYNIQSQGAVACSISPFFFFLSLLSSTMLSNLLLSCIEFVFLLAAGDIRMGAATLEETSMLTHTSKRTTLLDILNDLNSVIFYYICWIDVVMF